MTNWYSWDTFWIYVGKVLGKRSFFKPTIWEKWRRNDISIPGALAEIQTGRRRRRRIRRRRRRKDGDTVLPTSAFPFFRAFNKTLIGRAKGQTLLTNSTNHRIFFPIHPFCWFFSPFSSRIPFTPKTENDVHSRHTALALILSPSSSFHHLSHISAGRWDPSHPSKLSNLGT